MSNKRILILDYTIGTGSKRWRNNKSRWNENRMKSVHLTLRGWPRRKTRSSTPSLKTERRTSRPWTVRKKRSWWVRLEISNLRGYTRWRMSTSRRSRIGWLGLWMSWTSSRRQILGRTGVCRRMWLRGMRSSSRGSRRRCVCRRSSYSQLSEANTMLRFKSATHTIRKTNEKSLRDSTNKISWKMRCHLLYMLKNTLCRSDTGFITRSIHVV